MSFANQFRLDGKVALVSGGSRGIGEAICRGLAEYGATVIVASRKLESCETVAATIREAGYKAEAAQCHTGNVEEIESLFTDIEQRFGRLDILVNNAGTNLYYGEVGETPMSAFDKIVEINFRSPFFMCEKAVALMKDKGGAIVNVASISGLIPGRWQGAYSAAKAAMINMTKSFALEYGDHGIRANALCPGFVLTKLSQGIADDEEKMASLAERWPLDMVGQPDDMVGAVLYMVSDASAYMTGQSVIVDGGATTVLL
jgi:NAD(P)-dependent dehydrogenase (short-subunit alcohol dehydrogenase family)